MFCESCGKELRKGAKFCAYCGSPVEADTVTEEKEEFLMALSFTDAAYLATGRGKSWRKIYEGEEDYEPDQFEEECNAAKLLKFAEREDKKKKKYNNYPIYIVSKEGAIGELVDNVSEIDPDFGDIGWLVYTKKRMYKYLPKWQRDIIIRKPGP